MYYEADTIYIGAKTDEKLQKNDNEIVMRGSENYSSDDVKEIARLKKELKNIKDALGILKRLRHNGKINKQNIYGTVRDKK